MSDNLPRPHDPIEAALAEHLAKAVTQVTDAITAMQTLRVRQSQHPTTEMLMAMENRARAMKTELLVMFHQIDDLNSPVPTKRPTFSSCSWRETQGADSLTIFPVDEEPKA